MAKIIRLLDLSPRVQETILLGELDVSERRLRGAARPAEWASNGTQFAAGRTNAQVISSVVRTRTVTGASAELTPHPKKTDRP